jgi:hypothetical protein
MRCFQIIALILLSTTCKSQTKTDSTEILFVRATSQSQYDYICALQNEKVTEYDSIYWGILDCAIWLDNNIIVYPRFSGLHTPFIEPFYIAYDYKSHVSDSLKYNFVNGEQCLGLFKEDSIFAANYAPPFLEIYTLNAGKFNKLYQIDLGLGQNGYIRSVRISPTGEHMICIYEMLTKSPMGLVNTLIVNLHTQNIDSVSLKGYDIERPVVFESDSAMYFSNADSGTIRFQIEGIIQKIDSESYWLAGYYSNRYLVALDETVEGSRLLFYDANNHYNKVVIDSGIINTQVDYDRPNNRLLYSKINDNISKESEILWYFFDNTKTDIIYKSKGNIYNASFAKTY